MEILKYPIYKMERFVITKLRRSFCQKTVTVEHYVRILPPVLSVSVSCVA